MVYFQFNSLYVKILHFQNAYVIIVTVLVHKGGWASFLVRGGEAMSMYEILSLLVAVATLIYLITMDNKEK